MAIAARALPNPSKGGVVVEKEPTVAEMEKRLGLDKVHPVTVSDSDRSDIESKKVELRLWYEEEVRALYRRTFSTPTAK